MRATRAGTALSVALLATAVGGGALVAGAAQAGAATIGTFSATGSLALARAGAPARTLGNGDVLVAGGLTGSPSSPVPTATAELYNPSSGTWSGAGSLATGRYDATSTVLGNGDVLVAGGLVGTTTPEGSTASAELYNPATNRWTTTASMATARFGAVARLLPGGDVLVAGGDTGTTASATATATAELYNPASGTWSTAAPLPFATGFPQVAALSNGNVLVVGGTLDTGSGGPLTGPASADAALYDPATNAWSTVATLPGPREGATSTVLANGDVLVAGGNAGPGGGPLGSGELYLPATGTWSTTAPMLSATSGASAALLADGNVLLVGGKGSAGNPLAEAELYDPSNNTWTATGPPLTASQAGSIAVLSGGDVLVAGGETGSGAGSLTAIAELYLATAPAPVSISIPGTVDLTVGRQETVEVTTTGAPVPRLTEMGALPPGITFRDNGNGTATIAGTARAAGSFPITVVATSTSGSQVTKATTLFVSPARPSSPPPPPPPPKPVLTAGGYWLATSSGTPYAYGSAARSPLTGVALNPRIRPLVAVVSGVGGKGYYLVSSAGNVYNKSGAAFYGSTAHLRLAAPISSFAVTADGRGYWLVDRSGDVFAFGDASAYAPVRVDPRIRPVVALVPTRDGKGYYLVTSVGNVYNEGDAVFYGSKAHVRLPHPVIAGALSGDGRGYYLVTSGGNVYNLGDAPFYGSKASFRLRVPVIGFATSPDGKGYYIVTSAGNIYNYGDARFYGSPVHVALPAPIVSFSRAG